jgi:transcriptional regulator with XRE-family HTH domain
MTAAIPVRRRLVGRALREYRQGLGYSLDEAARILDCHRSKVSRVETGQRGITPGELRMLLAEYGVPKQIQDTLIALSKASGGNGWWRSYTDVLPAEFVDYAIMEAAACKVMIYEPQWVPALLQTTAYAEAIADASAAADDETRARLVDATLARQRAMLGKKGPDVSIILGEGALRQEVGGTAVMSAQIEALASGVPIHVLPFVVEAPATMQTGPMTILEFPGAPHLASVYLGGGVWTHDADTYREAFAILTDAALSPGTSRRFILRP